MNDEGRNDEQERVDAAVFQAESLPENKPKSKIVTFPFVLLCLLAGVMIYPRATFPVLYNLLGLGDVLDPVATFGRFLFFIVPLILMVFPVDYLITKARKLLGWRFF